MTFIFTLFILLLLNYTQAVTATQSQCRPLKGTDRNTCLRKIKNCAKQGIYMKWVGRGCRTDNKIANDGGCQCLDYCGYTCAGNCNADSQCRWTAASGCVSNSTGLPYVPQVCGKTSSPTYTCVGRTNLAMKAVASTESGGSGPFGPANLNDGIIPPSNVSICSSYSWNADNSYWQMTWTSPVTIQTFRIYAPLRTTALCGSTGRNLAGGVVQYLDSSLIYQNIMSFSNQEGTFDLVFPTTVTTTSVRIALAVVGVIEGGQNSNPSFFEWEIC